MSKRFIVDTNVLMQQPEVLELYDCVVPSHVNREVEHLELTRKQDRTLQYQIRQLKKKMDAVEFDFFNVKDYKFTLDEDLDPNYTDNILLQVAVDEGYGMITNDRLLRLKCKDYGIEVIKLEQSTYVEHKGFQEISLSETEWANVIGNPEVNSLGLMINEYAVLNNRKDGELLDVVVWTGGATESLRNEDGTLGQTVKTIQFDTLKPYDEYQIMAIDSIRRNQLTSIRGRAGSGKSLIALTTAWEMVEKEGYKLVVFCNTVPAMHAQELGFYTGSVIEKLLQSSIGTMLKSKFGDEIEIVRQIQEGRLEILPLVDIRGYDTTGQKVICWVVEAQNLTSELLKLGLQRISEDAKVIVDGDFHQQIDKEVYVSDNGMKRMSEVFRGHRLYGEIELQNVWRSELAEIADLM